jgi:hypothetical protein
MIRYEDGRTLIETNGRTVSILPRPAGDRDRAIELSNLFPEKGWTHYRYGIHQVVEAREKREALVREAEERVRHGAI